MRPIMILFVVLTCLVGTGIQPVFSELKDTDGARLVAANELLKVMKVDKSNDEMMNNLVDMQIKQQPAMAPYRKTFLEFFSKYMSWQSIKDDMVNIYAEAFSVEELKDLIAFYKSPTGQKATQLMPQLFKKGSELGQQRIQGHIQELQEMIKKEADRITKTTQ